MRTKTGQKSHARVKRRAKVKARIRKKINGSTERPRICVHRSLKHLYVQCIDDVKRHTIIGLNSRQVEELKIKNNCDIAFQLGELFGAKLKDAGVASCVFDRSGYLYHGRIKQLADGIRKAGVQL